MSKPTVLVIGSTGTVGAATVHRLLDSDSMRVLAGRRDVGRAGNVLPPSAQPVHIDLDVAESIRTVLEGVAVSCYSPATAWR